MRFTTSGADSGAAAWPRRRRARVPGTVGPDAGKVFAFADDATAAKRAAPITSLGLRGYTANFGACLMPQDFGLQTKKCISKRPFLGPLAILAQEWIMLYTNRLEN